MSAAPPSKLWLIPWANLLTLLVITGKNQFYSVGLIFTAWFCVCHSATSPQGGIIVQQPPESIIVAACEPFEASCIATNFTTNTSLRFSRQGVTILNSTLASTTVSFAEITFNGTPSIVGNLSFSLIDTTNAGPYSCETSNDVGIFFIDVEIESSK